MGYDGKNKIIKIEEIVQKKPKNELSNILPSKPRKLSIHINFKNKNATEISDTTNI
jgi:UDP-3-O-acyl-N-acetylglucosamine deacetylase